MSKKQKSKLAKPAEKKSKKPAAPHAEAKENKTEILVAMLKHPAGITLEALMKESGWQRHSVRGWISGTVQKKLGLAVASYRNAAGARAYVIGEVPDDAQSKKAAEPKTVRTRVPAEKKRSSAEAEHNAEVRAKRTGLLKVAGTPVEYIDKTARA